MMVQLNNFINKLEENLKIGEGNSPILFSGKNIELLNEKVRNISFELMAKFWVPKVNLFILEDNKEKLKIEDVKKFLDISNTSTPYEFQIFLIENISRMTLQSANSCLKFFEEPWKKNIIFLTNLWETWVLETVLSRVQFVYLWWEWFESKDEFFYSLIDSSLKWSKDLYNYFFKNKLEKDEYVRFLKTIILYAKQNFVFLEYLEEVNDDINAIINNNVNSRWVIDKWILKLG